MHTLNESSAILLCARVTATCSFDVAKVLVDAGVNPTLPGWMQLTALNQSQLRKRAEGCRVHQLLEQAAVHLGESGIVSNLVR